jgi:aminomethyltransferase
MSSMGEEPAIETAFHDVIVAAGGTHIADGGWMWAEGFGDLQKEYAAVRDDVAVWDVSPLNKWDFRGPEALQAAQHVWSNDALGLQVGQARYGGFLDEEGRLVDDGTVYRTGRPEHCWVMTNGKDHQGYFGEALKDFDVEFEWIAPSIPHLGVIGPRSRELVQGLTDADVSALKYFRFFPDPVKVGGVQVTLSRTGFGGEMGFELFLTHPEDARALWQAVTGAGATPFGTDAIEILRIEAGLIVTDYDYEAHQRTPYDFNLDKMVALDRPGIGKDALRAVAANPPNRFVTLKVDGDTVPGYGAAVTKGGDEIGVLTSPTASPRFGTIGLAIVPTDQAMVGNEVDVAVGDGTTKATGDGVPIYDPNKERPRA